MNYHLNYLISSINIDDHLSASNDCLDVVLNRLEYISNRTNQIATDRSDRMPSAGTAAASKQISRNLWVQVRGTIHVLLCGAVRRTSHCTIGDFLLETLDRLTGEIPLPPCYSCVSS
jgi:CII-binding regulator of phage lambda lysogenization HflD